MPSFSDDRDDDDDDAEVTIEANDLRGRTCAYCGATLLFEDWIVDEDAINTWDIKVSASPEGDGNDLYHRHYFCPDSCMEVAKHDVDWLKGKTRKGDYDAILEENIDGYV